MPTEREILYRYDRRDPQKALAQASAEAERNLQRLGQALSRYGKGTDDPWGRVGSLAHVNEKLYELLEFLG